MAVVPPHQPQTLTPPSSSHGMRGAWDFAVPLSSEHQVSHPDQKPYMSEDAGSKPVTHSRQPLSNGNSKPPLQQRTNTFDSQISGKSNHDESGHLMPNRVGALQRKTSDISAAGSDPDSLLDYYKPQPEVKTISRKASQTVISKDKRKPSVGASSDAEKDDSYWIHRDKLAQIERIELEAAGYRVGRSSRSGSRAASTTRPARERSHSDQHSENRGNGDERAIQEKKQRTVSPIPAEEEDMGDDEPIIWDIRTPEEIAAEQDRENMSPRHALRTSNSRIPIAKASAVPVPHTFVERDLPLPRSRKGSNAWSGDAIAVNGARTRCGSVGSQGLLDDVDKSGVEEARTPVRAEANYPASPTAESPPKAKVPGKTYPTGRKTSTARATSQKPRGASTNTTSPVKRPGTSSGAPRPSTGQRPEGEAPWLATMYKPDPRLPPDQQIIPTHAKRMQQEQWETEGRVGSVYDREFRLLNTDEFNKPERDSKDLHPFERKEDANEQWPLPSPTKTDRPGTSNGEPGSYTLTPRIASPVLPSQRNSVTRNVTSPKPVHSIRVQDPPKAAQAKEKGCGCCIVM